MQGLLGGRLIRCYDLSMTDLQKAQLQLALEKSWTRETSSAPDEWSGEWTSRGQCVPTALVAQDYLGGELQRLVTVFNGKEESHYRNLLPDGSIFDATRTQYPESQDLKVTEVSLNGFGSIREKRLSETNTLRRYQSLKSLVEQQLIKQPLN